MNFFVKDNWTYSLMMSVCPSSCFFYFYFCYLRMEQSEALYSAYETNEKFWNNLLSFTISLRLEQKTNKTLTNWKLHFKVKSWEDRFLEQTLTRSLHSLRKTRVSMSAMLFLNVSVTTSWRRWKMNVFVATCWYLEWNVKCLKKAKRWQRITVSF